MDQYRPVSFIIIRIVPTCGPHGAVQIEENGTDVLFSEEGGLGDMDIPIISDTTHALSKAYGVLKEDEGIAYRGLFIIDTKGK